MELNEQSIDAFTKIMKDPSKYGIPMRPISECFEATEVATPKHLLFKDYCEETKGNLPKVFFYIIMDTEYWDKIAKAPDGNAGYLLKFKPKD